jgi:protocatechuate 3,4-dioxygenase beta subunit
MQAGAGVQSDSGSGGNAAQGSAGAQANVGGGGMNVPSNSGSGSKASMDAGAQAVADTGMDDVAGTNVPWATGGTKSMKGGYPDPFTTGAAGAACMLYPAQEIGPCYANGPMLREDISDGIIGLPVRLSLKVVRSDGCTPVAGATVDVWHSGSDGIYSAFATGTICNPSTQDVMSEMFCRGVQTTDENGRVDFSTVFPGWYTGRTIHIHFTIRLNVTESVTSQLYFEDPLSDEILAQASYATRGMRDTTNATDMLFSSGGASPDQVLLETAKRPDGVLHAWKVLSIG